jgi:hypothetical protein
VLAAAAAGCAIAVAPAGAKTAPRGINYGGQSSHSDPVVMVLSKDGKHITTFAQEFEAKCTSGATLFRLVKTSGFKVSIRSSGSFSGQQQLFGTVDGQNAPGFVKITGKVKGRSMTGSISFAVAIGADPTQITDTCTSDATFKASAAKGKVFAGFTSQDGPVVAELNSSSKRVHHFHIGWQSTCKPEGGFQYGDTLTDFAIVGGAFGGSFTQQFGETTAEHESDAYVLKGRLTKSKLSGSIDVKTQEFDNSGAMTSDCDTGTVTFQGATG